MNELFDNIMLKIIELSKDMQLNVKNGNKAAGARARKTTLELEKLFKQYRRKSVESSKK